jgi:hypothetical protein
LLRPLPYPEPERLVVVQKDWKPFWAPNGEVCPVHDAKDVLAWQEFDGAFSQQTAYRTEEATLTGREAAELVTCGRVEAPFVSMFGAVPRLGRGPLDCRLYPIGCTIRSAPGLRPGASTCARSKRPVPPSPIGPGLLQLL